MVFVSEDLEPGDYIRAAFYFNAVQYRNRLLEYYGISEFLGNS